MSSRFGKTGSPFLWIILMRFSSRYDQAASNLGARLCFSTAQTRISIQAATRQPHHSKDVMLHSHRYSCRIILNLRQARCGLSCAKPEFPRRNSAHCSRIGVMRDARLLSGATPGHLASSQNAKESLTWEAECPLHRPSNSVRIRLLPTEAARVDDGFLRE